jgi:HK97 family phage prohead protease
MRLYEDTVEPLRIAGYASTFGLDYRLADGTWERVGRNAFQLGGRPVALCIAHLNDRPDTRFASTRDRTLALWQDHHGLAFSASVAWDAGALTLLNGIRRGEFVGCSVGFARREVETVRKAELDEISLVAAPACPFTAVWVEDESADDLPAYVAQARGRWLAGRMAARAAQDAARRSRAHVSARSAKPTCPLSVVAALARYGPRGV